MRFKSTAARTDVGRQREHNEDAVLVHGDLVAVADGMGGEAAGEVASAVALQVVDEHADELLRMVDSARGPQVVSALEALFRTIDERIQTRAARDGVGRMGTTLVLALGGPEGVYIAHCGDSRAYLMRGDLPVQLTEDHNVRNMLRRRGLPQEQAAAHPAADRLVQALGMGRVDPDVAKVRLGQEDVLLLCSDGLSGPVPERELSPVVGEDLDTAAHDLIRLANTYGGPDNISVVLVRARSDASSRVLARRVERLAATELFQGLDPTDLWRVAPYLQTERFRPGQTLVHEGDEGHGCIIIVEGEVDVHRGDLHLTTLGPGTNLGEPALIRPWRRSAAVTARTAVLGFSLTRWAFEELLVSRPRIGTRILRSVASGLADRLVDLTDRIEASG